jgi:CheY-like chemotaxis protein
MTTDSPGASAPPSCRIVIADDNADAARILALILEIGGHRVTTAIDGPGALAAIRAEQPQLALLDISLPGMSGLELARAVRAEPAIARTRLVAITGYSRDEDVRRSLEAGFDEHLAKPVGSAILHAAVARAVAVAR